MESDWMLCVYFTFLALMYVVSAWFLLRSSVKAIPAADAEDRRMGLYCEPETLWDIYGDIDHGSLPKPMTHWQLDAVIKALHKGGYVILGPSRQEITEAAAMYHDGRMIS